MRGDKIREGLAHGSSGCAAAVEHGEMRAVVGLVSVVDVRLDVAVTSEDPGGRVGACVANVVFEGGVYDSLGWRGDANCAGGCR